MSEFELYQIKFSQQILTLFWYPKTVKSCLIWKFNTRWRCLQISVFLPKTCKIVEIWKLEVVLTTNKSQGKQT